MLQNGAEAVDPTLFSPDIIVEDEDKKNNFWKRFLKRKRISKDDQERGSKSTLEKTLIGQWG
jgi:hypothetical protein